MQRSSIIRRGEQLACVGQTAAARHRAPCREIREPADAPSFGECALAEPLAEILARRGIERLYAHQAEAIEEDPFAKKGASGMRCRMRAGQ